MPADTLLSRLEKVKATGSSRWLACCPAHEDRTPSLALRELDDGRVLVHCFTGCSTAAILASVGLEFSDLYPERLTAHHTKSERRPFAAADVLRALEREALITQAAAQFVLEGRSLAASDVERLQVAVERIQQAVSLSGVRRYE